MAAFVKSAEGVGVNRSGSARTCPIGDAFTARSESEAEQWKTPLLGILLAFGIINKRCRGTLRRFDDFIALLEASLIALVCPLGISEQD